MEIPTNHPRHRSLVTREALAAGVRDGLVHATGLVAHGRGEAFDYLLGERTPKPARRAAQAAAAHLLLARHPVLSVNGNVAVLAAREVAALQEATGARVEVNLFHRTDARVEKLAAHLERAGCRDVLGKDAAPRIPGLDSARGTTSAAGIFAADVVLVPLEDGDRAEALRRMGKVVLAVDLNPMSRTALAANVTIVDEVTRALPNVLAEFVAIRRGGTDAAREIVGAWDNAANLRASAQAMADHVRGFDFETVNP